MLNNIKMNHTNDIICIAKISKSRELEEEKAKAKEEESRIETEKKALNDFHGAVYALKNDINSFAGNVNSFAGNVKIPIHISDLYKSDDETAAGCWVSVGSNPVWRLPYQKLKIEVDMTLNVSVTYKVTATVDEGTIIVYGSCDNFGSVDEVIEHIKQGCAKYINENEKGNYFYKPPELVQQFFAGSLSVLGWIIAIIVYLLVARLGSFWIILGLIPAILVYLMVTSIFGLAIYVFLFIFLLDSMS